MTVLPSGRALRLLDAATALWVAVWIAVGVAIAIEVHRLTQLGQTVTLSGSAIEAVGRTLNTLSGLPFAGGSIGRAAQEIERAGSSTVSSGQASSSSVAP